MKAARLTATHIGAFACAAAGVVLFQCYGNANRGYIDTASLFYWWGFQWTNTGSEAEHGWLVLGLTAWLLWRNLQSIADCGLRIGESERVDRSQGGAIQEVRGQGSGARSQTPGSDPVADPAPQSAIRNPQSSAAIAMISAMLLHAVGFAAQQARLSILALLLFTWGVFRLFGGRRWGAAAAFPLAFMIFAIPINALDSIGFWLRVWVVNASGLIARGVGINVLQSGTQLLAPDGSYNYDVAAACSGIVGSSRVDLQACKLEYSIVSPK